MSSSFYPCKSSPSVELTGRIDRFQLLDATGTTNAGVSSVTACPDTIGTTPPQPNMTNGLFVFQTAGPQVCIIPLLSGDNLTATIKVFALMQVVSPSNPNLVQWVPVQVCSIAATAGARTGVAGGPVTTASFYCDTLVSTDRLPASAGLVRTTQLVVGVTDDLVGAINVPTLGSPIMLIHAIRGTSASVNILAKTISQF